MLTFHYSSMGAGKSAKLIQMNHNFNENKLNTYVATYRLDNRDGEGIISSRTGLHILSNLFDESTDFYREVFYQELKPRYVNAVFIDEAQFLTPDQVVELGKLSNFQIQVHCFGLRTDFLGNLFPGSSKLLGIADKLIEIEAVARDGLPATMQIRLNEKGERVRSGPQVEIGYNYIAVSRKEFYSGTDQNSAS